MRLKDTFMENGALPKILIGIAIVLIIVALFAIFINTVVVDDKDNGGYTEPPVGPNPTPTHQVDLVPTSPQGWTEPTNAFWGRDYDSSKPVVDLTR